MTSNDHIVPQMYLRRFAQKRKKSHVIKVTDLGSSKTFQPNVKNVATRSGFHIHVDSDGQPTHEAERLFGSIEGGASPSFKSMLDDPDYALPRRWPMSDVNRRRMAWWLAAQLLRTNRQRQRLDALDGEQLPPPENIRTHVANNRHLSYVARMLGAVVFIMHNRPWGLGFSNACLMTSDVPVLVLNGQDDADQALAAAYWDVVLPLDPHRFLILPGVGSIDESGKQSDHLTKLDGGLGIFLNQAIYDAADRQVFLHPDHADVFDLVEPDGRLPRPELTVPVDKQPQYILTYRTIPVGSNIERRWLTDHPPRRLKTAEPEH